MKKVRRIDNNNCLRVTTLPIGGFVAYVKLTITCYNNIKINVKCLN